MSWVIRVYLLCVRVYTCRKMYECIYPFLNRKLTHAPCRGRGKGAELLPPPITGRALAMFLGFCKHITPAVFSHAVLPLLPKPFTGPLNLCLPHPRHVP